MASMDTGWVNPATGANDGGDWTNPGNAINDDGAFVTNTKAKNTNTGRLYTSNYGFNISPMAIIDGIEIQISRKSSGDNFSDSEVFLMSAAGTTQGANQSLAGDWPTAETMVLYGGAANLMGWAAITSADINSANFGVGLIAARGGTNADVTASVDVVQVKIYYTIEGNTMLLNMGAF